MMLRATIPVADLVAAPPSGIDPETQGWLASRAARGFSANPYVWGSAPRHHWYQGYWRWRLDPSPLQFEDVVQAEDAGTPAAAARDGLSGGPEGAPPVDLQKGLATLEPPDAEAGKEAAVGSVDGGIPIASEIAPATSEASDDVDPMQCQLDAMEGDPGDDEDIDGPSEDPGGAQDDPPPMATATRPMPAPGPAIVPIRPRAQAIPPALDQRRHSADHDRLAIDRAIAAGNVRVLPAIETLGSLPLCDTEDQAIAELTRLGRRVRKTGRREFTLDGRRLDFEGLKRAARYAVRMEAAWKKGVHP